MKGLRLIALVAFGLSAAAAASAQTMMSADSEAGKKVMAACSADFEKLCPGDGNRTQCIMEKRTEMSSSCQAALDEVAEAQGAGGDIGG